MRKLTKYGNTTLFIGYLKITHKTKKNSTMRYICLRYRFRGARCVWVLAASWCWSLSATTHVYRREERTQPGYTQRSSKCDQHPCSESESGANKPRNLKLLNREDITWTDMHNIHVRRYVHITLFRQLQSGNAIVSLQARMHFYEALLTRFIP